jgi:hypothetical protein
MSTIKIDNIDYDLDTLSQEAKSNLQMVQVVEQEIQRLQMQLAITQTARNAYGQALKASLPTPLEQVMAQGEILKFS